MRISVSHLIVSFILITFSLSCIQSPTAVLDATTNKETSSERTPILTTMEMEQNNSSPMPTLMEDSAGANIGVQIPRSQPHGDVFAYLKMSGSKTLLVLIQSDASGSFLYELPFGAIFGEDPLDGLSPNGKYFAYFTGELGDWGSPPSIGEVEAFINIAELPELNLVHSSSLLSETYPENLLSTASDLISTPPQSYEAATVDELAMGMYLAFQSGLTSLDWSPDSRQLAFASQDPGPSSDLHVFDLQLGEISQLSSGPGMIQDISWSSDGEWIAHASIIAAAMGTDDDWHFARSDGSEIVSFSSASFARPGWIDPNTFAVSDGANGIGSFDLRLLQPSSGRVIELWSDAYASYAYDNQSSVLAVAVFDQFLESDLTTGTYIVESPFSMPQLIDRNPISPLFYWGSPEYRYIGQYFRGDIVGITFDGQIEPILQVDASIQPSPDRNFIAYKPNGSDAHGLFLYDLDSQNELLITEAKVDQILWTPDSKGLFYVAEDQLHYYGIASSDSILVDSALGWTFSYIPHYRWIQLD